MQEQTNLGNEDFKETEKEQNESAEEPKEIPQN